MASVLFFAPLLAAHILMQGETREIGAHGVAIRAAAAVRDGHTVAQLEVRAFGTKQRIDLPPRASSPEALLASIEVVDANFDGAPDLVVGGDVYLYDARAHKFSNASPLAAELSRVPNARFDAQARTVISRTSGASNPSRVTYAIERGSLREIAACRFLNPTEARVGTLVRSRGGHTTYTPVRLAPSESDPCASY
jgi:hypothetical protein